MSSPRRVEVDAANGDRDDLRPGGPERVAHRLERVVLAGAGEQARAERASGDDELILDAHSRPFAGMTQIRCWRSRPPGRLSAPVQGLPLRQGYRTGAWPQALAGTEAPMRFRKGAKLDSGQVTDVRGRGGGRGLAVGGGGTRDRRRARHLPPVHAALRTAAGSVSSRRSTTSRSARATTPERLGRTAGRARTRTSATTAASSASSTASQKFWDGVFQRSNERTSTSTRSSSPTR